MSNSTEKPNGVYLRFDGDKLVGSFKGDDGTCGIAIHEVDHHGKIGGDFKEMDGRYDTPTEDGIHILAFVKPESIDVVIEKLKLAKESFTK